MTTLILAKIFGLYFLALGISLLVNPDRFRKMYQQVAGDQNFILLGSMFALLLGAVVVSIHNVWVFHWPVIITILGWWSLVKGFALLVHPDSITLFAFIQDRSKQFYQSLSIVYIVLGIFLLYKGFG